MKKTNVKYSIIIPARNGGHYLPTCVDTIVSQGYEDYELIISDDHSTDNSAEYLKTIRNSKVQILTPAEGLSMAEHWEWALSHARGDWLIFVGQDDGLQPYFFNLADVLTGMAEKKNVRTIMSQRAYFFWQGCETMYGDCAVGYAAVAKVRILDCKFQAMLALLGFKTYFELPEMYTTSLFKKEIIEEAKDRQNGSLFVTHPQDANLAAIACSLDDKYIYSSIPLGWVGSSPKSAGMAVNSSFSEQDLKGNQREIDTLRQEYLCKTANSKLKIHPLTGDFSFASSSIYFWGALLQTASLRKKNTTKLLLSKKFKTILLSSVLAEVMNSKKFNVRERQKKFLEIVELNKCNYHLINFLSKVFLPAHTLYNVIIKSVNKFLKLRYRSISFIVNWNDNNAITMLNASQTVAKMVDEKRMLQKI